MIEVQYFTNQDILQSDNCDLGDHLQLEPFPTRL